ncbi:hypothetical protein KKI90_22810 [Xenorhabdus bovienii]|uniref:hypothetical protein n=1 Tax=Xenorhabdus bovienii TaxID=40576 RepID=UPI00237C88CC|nr:hypothetical protein [Xenorhabdus bovienii]MDE1489053.1 hypothetical protein [Xenorhabdus bovienii]MDE1497405.1 hypothetical protein [Xenorhabdus bovienii]MDE9446612.1 hypothetical protein [Xenorhabdus bovienii]MDE9475394.1 hypothetical protein [Xenorhabdus bovienii]MDE9479928.1 hypothetical protein [Xenorhabdus bovienii]
MNKLEKALNELVKVHKKFNLQGKFEESYGADQAWPNYIKRSEEISFLFEKFSPVNIGIETGFTPIKLFNFDEIEGAQYGYGWIKNSGEITKNPNWPDNNLVFMDDIGGGKPIIALLDTKDTPVYASYDSEKPFKISDSLVDFFLSLSKLIEIVYGEFDIFEICDEDDELKTEFVEMISKEIEPLIGSENFGNFFDYFYG